MNNTRIRRLSLRMSSLIAALFAASVLSGCAHVITGESLRKADRDLTFAVLMKNPEAHRGKTVLLGGTVIGVENREETTVLEVLEEPLSGGLKPGDPEKSGGRFLVEFKGFLDPALWAGRPVTVVGTVKSIEEKTLGKMPYAYPVITPIEHYLWRRGQGYDSPGVTFGIGVGIFHGD